MKIGELDNHCGNCKLLDNDLCGEPYSEVHMCKIPILSEMEESEYMRRVEEIRKKSKRHWSNLTLQNKVCDQIEKENKNV